MPLNSDQLLAVFLHPVLTKIIGEPNLANITLQQSKHNGNLASIKSIHEAGHLQNHTPSRL